jgi:hypothetical protein
MGMQIPSEMTCMTQGRSPGHRDVSFRLHGKGGEPYVYYVCTFIALCPKDPCSETLKRSDKKCSEISYVIRVVIGASSPAVSEGGTPVGFLSVYEAGILRVSKW